MATQDRKPLVHLTVHATAILRGLELRPDDFNRTLCSRDLLGEYAVGSPQILGDRLAWHEVTCPECIIAMDSDE